MSICRRSAELGRPGSQSGLFYSLIWALTCIRLFWGMNRRLITKDNAMTSVIGHFKCWPEFRIFAKYHNSYMARSWTEHWRLTVGKTAIFTNDKGTHLSSMVAGIKCYIQDVSKTVVYMSYIQRNTRTLKAHVIFYGVMNHVLSMERASIYPSRGFDNNVDLTSAKIVLDLTTNNFSIRLLFVLTNRPP